MAYFDIKTIEASGKERFKIRVREKHKLAPIKGESKTFDLMKDALFWAERTKQKLEQELAKALSPHQQLPTADNIIFSNFEKPVVTVDSTLGEVIEHYLDHEDDAPNPISRTSRGSLNLIKKYELAHVPINQINFEHLMQFCKQRLTSCSAKTVRVDISSAMRAIREVAGMLELEITDSVIKKHHAQLKRDGFIADSPNRSRRLLKGEYRKIIRGFRKYQNSGKVKNNYVAMIALYIETTLRSTELAALTWNDIDFVNEVIHVNTGKNTVRGRVGADAEPRDIPLWGLAAKILRKLKPEHVAGDTPLFTITGKSLSSKFPKVMKKIGITGLQQRDLRREGISRLLEMGLSEVLVAEFTGHKDYQMIRDVYKNLNAKNIIKNLDLIQRIKTVMHNNVELAA
jgi:integrase